MSVVLVPLIEINYDNSGIRKLLPYDYWNHPDIWADYHQQCLLNAGFSENLHPYLKGYPFYAVEHFKEGDLSILVSDIIQKFEFKDLEAQLNPFSGGFALQQDGDNIFLPQCCSCLNDIYYWERLASGKQSYCEGHPSPKVIFEGEEIILDFCVEGFDESFSPPPTKNKITFSCLALLEAVSAAKEILFAFQGRLEAINAAMEWGINDIGKSLIWDLGNHDISYEQEEKPYGFPPRESGKDFFRRTN